MTSVPRDPAFWRRFSMAVHLNEDAEKNSRGIGDPAMSPRPVLNHTYVFSLCLLPLHLSSAL